MEQENNELDIRRHSTAHVLAQAVKRLYPDTKIAIGPSIRTGFYYDFEFSAPKTQNDFDTIEAEMKKIVKEDLPIVRETLSRDEAKKLFAGRGEPYKVELIEELPAGEEITVFKQGEFVDLCRGPHINRTGKLKHFKLTSLTGAYWKGSEKNRMLTRIYGTAFATADELSKHLEALEEAKKRDHNKLGRELKYFMTDEKIGQGLPLIMPAGAQVLKTLIRFVEDEEQRRGYLYTRTPAMAKSDLYKVSGHWDHYRDGMFVLGEEQVDDGYKALRPMTCPFQYQIYNNGIKSYRDLPVRFNETATLFRNENSGEMHGLIRVRQFTLSDGHIICRPDQLEAEFKGVMDLIYYILDVIGLREDITFRFSKWDPKNTDKYINNPVAWEKTQDLMRGILVNLGIKFTEAEGEAAFYGPKLDLQIRNVYGKEDTIITVQVDFCQAERFDMTYVAEDGTKQRPYIIHRSSIGCYERTLALLIEKYNGALPVWLAPVQVAVMSLTDRTIDDVTKASSILQKSGLRVFSDTRSEKIGFKIREAQLEKTPYMLIIGDKDKEAGVVSVRHRFKGDLGTMALDAFIETILTEIKEFK